MRRILWKDKRWIVYGEKELSKQEMLDGWWNLDNGWGIGSKSVVQVVQWEDCLIVQEIDIGVTIVSHCYCYPSFCHRGEC